MPEKNPVTLFLAILCPNYVFIVILLWLNSIQSGSPQGSLAFSDGRQMSPNVVLIPGVDFEVKNQN